MREHGLTLIELVVAMAVFALVAVMATQSLSWAMDRRDRLSGQEAALSEVARAEALLRRDIAALVPVVIPEGGVTENALAWDGARLGLTVAGMTTLDARGQIVRAGMTRVTWLLEGGVLSRQQGQGPAVPVMAGVTGLGLRSFDARGGWQDGIATQSFLATLDSDNAGASFSTTLPAGVAVEITRASGVITVMEALQ